MKSTTPVLLFLFAAILTSTTTLDGQRRGIEGKVAPALDVKTWINLPKGKKSIDIADYRGKVVYLYCFQSWCPACLSHGFPLLQKMVKHYAGQDDIVFLAVQTVFEGHRVNTSARAKSVAVGRFKLRIPVGHDVGANGKRSTILGRYRTGGTPWIVLIGKKGIVRYNNFGTGLKPAPAIRLVDSLRTEKTLVGTRLGGFKAAKFIGKPPGLNAQQFTLIRWWTEDCPFCRDSLPALEALRKRHDNLEVLAMYHAKPMREVKDRQVETWAREVGFAGPLAIDQKMELYRGLRARGLSGGATSISILIDKTGVIRWVHERPRLHGGKKHAKAAADLAELERLLVAARGPGRKQRDRKNPK